MCCMSMHTYVHTVYTVYICILCVLTYLFIIHNKISIHTYVNIHTINMFPAVVMMRHLGKAADPSAVSKRQMQKY